MSVEKIFVDPSNAEKILSDIYTELDTKADKNNIPVATTSAVGGVKSGGDISVSSSGAVTVSSSGKLKTSAGSSTQPVYFSGGVPKATAYTLGKSVPSNAKFTDTTYSNATESTAGLMSAADKIKLDGLSAGGGKENYTLIAEGTGSVSGVYLSSPITNFDKIIIYIGTVNNAAGPIIAVTEINANHLKTLIDNSSSTNNKYKVRIRMPLEISGATTLSTAGFYNYSTFYLTAGNNSTHWYEVYGVK